MARVSSGRMQLAVSSVDCWTCGKPTSVFALIVPAGGTAIDDGDDGESGLVTELTALNEVEQVGAELGTKLATQAPTFRLDTSKTLGAMYWMNHCQACGAKIGDHFLHRESDGPFFSSELYAAGALIDLGQGELICAMPYAVEAARSSPTKR
jgi:hypothetical protein